MRHTMDSHQWPTGDLDNYSLRTTVVKNTSVIKYASWLRNALISDTKYYNWATTSFEESHVAFKRALPNLSSDGYFDASIWASDAHRKLESSVRSDIFRWVEGSAIGPFDGSLWLQLENLDNFISMGPYQSKRIYSSPSPRPIGKCHSEQSIWAFDARRRTHRRRVSSSRNLLAEKKFWRPQVCSLEPSIPIGHICRTGGRWDSNTCTYDYETYVDALI